MISTIFLLNEEEKFVETLSVSDGCKGRLVATSISDILCLFGQGNFTFITKKVREKSGNFEKRCLWQP